MQAFHDLVEHVLEFGVDKPDRTGVGSRSSVGHAMRFVLTDGAMPALTTKKLAFEAVKGELLGFFRGYTSAAQFRALGCKVWDQNANENAAWLANPARRGQDDLGRIYGAQWTGWEDVRALTQADMAGAGLSLAQEVARLNAAGYEVVAEDAARGVVVLRRRINQLEAALRELIVNPTSRRVVISGWNVGQLDDMALPPCHVTYWFGIDGRGMLHSTMWMRSNDLFLGAPFNIASLGIFTHLMARLCGREAASATVFVSDAHLYANHFEQARQMLSRQHLSVPKIAFSENVRKVQALEEIRGVFERIEPGDIWLEGYESHGPIRAPMAV